MCRDLRSGRSRDAIQKPYEHGQGYRSGFIEPEAPGRHCSGAREEAGRCSESVLCRTDVDGQRRGYLYSRLLELTRGLDSSRPAVYVLYKDN